MADDNLGVRKERQSVSKLTKMFERKSTEGSRKSAQNSNALKAFKDDLNRTYTETEEVDDIFDDITMPNTVRKRNNSVLDKVQMFNKTDKKDAEKILKTVIEIASDKPYLKLPEQSKSTRSGSLNIEQTEPQKIDKLDISRKNSEPLKDVHFSPLKKKPLSVRHMINKIEKIEERKKENTEECKNIKTEESVETVVKDKISVIQETREYEDTSKREQNTVISSPCKSMQSNDIGFKIKGSDKLGYYELDDTGKSMCNLSRTNLNITTFNSERETENKVKVVNKLETTNKLSCFKRLLRCFKK